MMKKVLLQLLVIFIIAISINSFCFADDIDEEIVDVNSKIDIPISSIADAPTVNSRSCVILDRLSKKILYGKNEKNQVKMASTTKIMTAIVVIENGNLDRTVEVSKKAANTRWFSFRLKYR